MAVQILCPYAINKSHGVTVEVLCEIDNQYCGLYRYCPQLKGPTMTDTYIRYGCMKSKKKELKDMARSKNTKNDSNSHLICEVNFNDKSKNRTSIKYNLNGKNYSVFIDGIYEAVVDVEYKEPFCKTNIIRITQM